MKKRELVLGQVAIVIGALSVFSRVLVEAITGKSTSDGDLTSFLWDVLTYGGLIVGFIVAVRYNYFFLRRWVERRSEKHDKPGKAGSEPK